MSLFAKDGTAKLVAQCSCPLTAIRCVTRVYTEYATFHLGADGVTATSVVGVTLDELRRRVPVPLLAEQARR